MKKLMIAACAVAFAAVSQAATVSWQYSAGEVYSGYKASSIGGSYSGSNEAGSEYWIVLASYSQSDLLTQLRDGKTMDDLSKNVLDSGVVAANGKISGVTKDVSDSHVVDDVISTYLVVSDGDDNYYIGSANEAEFDDMLKTYVVEISTSNTKKLRDNDATAAYGSAGWYSAAAVPEPFSGSLAVLGMGLLALRRKMKKAKKA